MNLQANVNNVDVLQNTIQGLQEDQNQLSRLIQDDLNAKYRLLDETRQEESISNNMLMVAKAVEAEKLAELMAAEAELAAAIASENPFEIAAASSRLATATQEYNEAKDHRERLDHRYELAKECVSIAECMISETEQAYSYRKTIVSEKVSIGSSRLFNAKNDLVSYLSKTSNSISIDSSNNKTNSKTNNSSDSINSKDASKKEPKLTADEHDQIKKETGWSDFVIDHIKSMEQYEIYYKRANLKEKEVNGRKCLVREIDAAYVDPKTGRTNKELMEMGRSPYDATTGQKIELHHMDQDFYGPFAELTENTEHGDGNQTKLHLKGSDSWRNDPAKQNKYKNYDRPNHWRTRAEEI